MPGHVVLIVVLVIVAVDLILVPLILRAFVASSWGPISARYPAVAPLPDAVRRNFQSFKVGMANFGFSVHVAADSAHLHLMPTLLMRWSGMKPASVPWEAVRAEGRPGRMYAKVRIDGQSQVVTGPAWALSLAGDAGRAGGSDRAG
ncbi:MAG TPA: hypothetical protein PLU35_11615 [Phycisphaerales bacterium]|nr:hypothetical protein [Phycisphaerales bacterium]